MNSLLRTKWLVPIYVITLEILFHLEVYGTVDGYIWNTLWYSISFSALVLFCSNTKWQKWNVGLRCVALLLITVYYTVQLIYHQVFGNFMSLKSIFNGAGQAMDFGSTIWEAFLKHAGVILLAFCLWVVYLVLEILCYRRGAFQTKKVWRLRDLAIYVFLILVVPVICTVVLMWQGTGVGSTYDVRMTFHRTEQSMYRLGLLQTAKKDLTENLYSRIGLTEKQVNRGYMWIENMLFKDMKGEGVDAIRTATAGVMIGELSEQKDDTPIVRYHIWDIDFSNLIASEKNEDIKDVHSYFSKQEPEEENEFTGLFEGYNLIYISAESFSGVAIDKDRTPILYQMQQEGFQFENFYTPSWYLSTIDGEYVNCLGQIPVDGDWSLQHSAENTLPVALGNQLKKKGYICNAYHNHDAYYYDRTITHPKLGYTFKADGSGLEFKSKYPESDLELMEITADEYIGKEPFHTYYMTMSGHLPYTYQYNSMAVKNRDVVEGEWSENAACYLAAHVELEHALAYLIEELTKSGQLDKTLFVIAPDHYPYGLKDGAYDELAGKEIEDDDFELYRNTCLIWSASMKNMDSISFPVKVEKCCSNLDIIPTISNLMGLDYDSRLFAGQDMLSVGEGLVMFKDQSFLTEKLRYQATTGEVVWATGVKEDTRYLEQLMKRVQDKFYYSGKILQLDYYRLIGQ